MDPYTCSAGVLPLTGVPDQSSVLTPAGWIYRSPVGNCFFAPHVMHPFPPSSQWLWCPPVPYGSPDAFQGHRPGSVVVCPPMTVLPGGHEVRAPAPIRRQRRNRRRRGCATCSSTTPAPHSRTLAERPTLERVVPVDRPTDVPVGRPTDAPPPGVAPANDDTVASSSVIQSPVAASAIPEPLLSVSTPLVTSSLQQYVQRHFDCPLGCCVTPAANLSSSSSVTGASDSDDTLLANNAFGLRVSRTTFSRMMNSIDSRIINEASDEPSSLSRRVEQPGSSSTDVAVVLGADSTQDRPVLVERRSAFHRYSRPASRSSASSVEILLGPIHADSSPASPTPIPQVTNPTTSLPLNREIWDIRSGGSYITLPQRFVVSCVEAIRSIYACFVCDDLIYPHYFQCDFGHSICDRCASRVNRCPECRCAHLSWRNITLERQTASLYFPCRHFLRGCREFPSAAAWMAHCDNCVFREPPMSPSRREAIDQLARLGL
ncbi:hypothetical protein QAD02_003426 [Eretmocerus hayati]|uniref:Uncharacterized protein n=1 Tax=Eretmocerus hayati TaxID=131215 RepID=A0ACC2NM26_9HYME|nr:hypothetical protein QAD02_003426 [Eretmocerus hayati]